MELSVLVEKYEKYLPVTHNSPHLTLGEGDTPLIRVPSLEMLLDERVSRKYHRHITRNLMILGKLEHEQHSTYSFKDRGMIIAVIKALEEGKKMLLCASTGNTAASAAAYGAAAGLPVMVIVPKGIATGKLSQIRMYGAEVMEIDGDFNDALKLAQKMAEKNPDIQLVNSVNKYRIEGQKTAAFEICDVLGDAPDYLFLPVGNAGNITAYWKGFNEYFDAKKISKLPKMMGYQAAGAYPIVRGHRIRKPKTDASAIRIGNPASWEYATQARDESGGLIYKVTDRQMYRAQYFLSALSGNSIYVELASSASVAGMLKYDLQKPFDHGSTIVFVVTGAGVKDPASAEKNPFKKEIIKLRSSMNPHLIAKGIIKNYDSRRPTQLAR